MPRLFMASNKETSRVCLSFHITFTCSREGTLEMARFFSNKSYVPFSRVLHTCLKRQTNASFIHGFKQEGKSSVCVFFYKYLKAQARKLHGWRAIVGWFEVLLQATAYGKTKTEETKR